MSALLHTGLPTPSVCTEADLDLRIAQLTDPLPPMPAEACTEIGAEPEIDPTDWALGDFTLVAASMTLGLVFLTNFAAAISKALT